LEQRRQKLIDMYKRGLERVQRTKGFFEGLSEDEQDIRILYVDDANHHTESPMTIAEAISDLSESESHFQKWIEQTKQATDPSALKEEIDSYGAHGGSMYLLESEVSIPVPENSLLGVYGDSNFEEVWAKNGVEK